MPPKGASGNASHEASHAHAIIAATAVVNKKVTQFVISSRTAEIEAAKAHGASEEAALAGQLVAWPI
jgi:hypothetical protein